MGLCIQEYAEQLLQKLTDTTHSWSSASFERQTALVQLFETDMLRSFSLPLLPCFSLLRQLALPGPSTVL